MSTQKEFEVVAVEGLTKKYGRRTVVDDVDLHLTAGSITGLIGPNGAGKTTIMSMLLGLVRPSAGRGTVLGHDLSRPADYLPQVGALIEGPAFFGNLSGRGNLEYFARLGGHDLSGIPEVLELVGLQGREGDSYSSYSLGMKQRLGIGAALLSDPQLVILDEPTNGVDPAGMRDIRAMVRRIAADGRTVLISSHLLAELEHICDRGDRAGPGWLALLRAAERAADVSAGSDPAARLRSVRRRSTAPDAEHRRAHHRAPSGRLRRRRRRRRPLVAGRSAQSQCSSERDPPGRAAPHQKQSLEDRVLDLVGTGTRS